MIKGYARVSSKDQNLDRQLEAFKKFGVKRCYVDKMSGKNFSRKGYQMMLDELQPGDVLVIKAIDRLGRNYDLIREEWRRITKDKQCDIVVLDMPLLDTREKNGKDLTGKFIADLVLEILSYVAEVERGNIKQRQKEGIKIAKAKGIKFGRPSQEITKQQDDVIKQYLGGGLTYKQAIEQTKMKRSTFYLRAKKIKEGGITNGQNEQFYRG